MKDKKEKKEKRNSISHLIIWQSRKCILEEMRMVKAMWNISIRMRTERWRKRL